MGIKNIGTLVKWKNNGEYKKNIYWYPKIAYTGLITAHKNLTFLYTHFTNATRFQFCHNIMLFDSPTLSILLGNKSVMPLTTWNCWIPTEFKNGAKEKGRRYNEKWNLKKKEMTRINIAWLYKILHWMNLSSWYSFSVKKNKNKRGETSLEIYESKVPGRW